MTQIHAWAKLIESKHALFLFDSCYSGSILKERSFAVPRQIQALTAKPVRMFISAGTAGEPVPAESFFRHIFIRGIRGDADLDKDECTRVNVYGTERLLKAASMAGCKWFIFGSSREVYGEPTIFPVSEEHGVNPINHYGHAKVLGENMVRNHCEANGMVQSILRFSNVYGHPRDHHTRLINAFIRRALLNRPLEIHGGGQVFDFTFIDDTVTAIFAAAEKLQVDCQNLPPMHILPGEPVGIEELAALIIEITESDSEVVHTSGRDYDVETFHGSPVRMQESLNFSCQTNIRIGLEQSIELFESEIQANGGMIQ